MLLWVTFCSRVLKKGDFLLSVQIRSVTLCVLFSGPANVFAPPRVEYHTRQHERLRGSYQHTFTSLLIFTQWVSTTWQHQHKRKRIWKCNITTFSELNEKYKVSLCSIFCLQGYCGPAWTHTVLALSLSLSLTEPDLTVSLFLRSPTPSVNHKWPRLPTVPALHKKDN